MDIYMRLIKSANQLDTEGFIQEADILDKILISVTKSGKTKSAGCRKKYINSDTGNFKGAPGERFDNCVKYQKCLGKSQESAKKICGAIKKKKYGGLDEDIIIAQQLDSTVDELGYRYLTEAELESTVREYQQAMPDTHVEEEAKKKLRTM